MKKVLAVLCVVAMMGGLVSSCKKDCTCKPTNAPDALATTTTGVKKSDCKDHTVKQGPIEVKYTCTWGK